MSILHHFLNSLDLIEISRVQFGRIGMYSYFIFFFSYFKQSLLKEVIQVKFRKNVNPYNYLAVLLDLALRYYAVHHTLRKY